MTIRSIGVTGSRSGPVTLEQAEQAASWFEHFWENTGVIEFHHGDCVGVDEWAATGFGGRWYLVSHPPIDPKFRAFVHSDFEYDPKPYLERNRQLVDRVDLLVALPRWDHGISGTGYTIEYAQSTGTPLVIVYPDGSMIVEPKDVEWNR